MNMQNNPLLYEINTRVWIKKFGNNIKLDEIPIDFFKELYSKGFKYVWLMGVWQTSKNSIKKYCFEEALKKEYDAALSDWQKDDVIGSPFAIEDYIVNPELGGEKSLKTFKEKLNHSDLKLILDFIPNHFNAESSLLKSNSEIFLSASEEKLQTHPKTFFVRNGKIFAHGKDPFFEPWQDTAQINYFSKDAHNFMISKLENISQLCDGIRCDMAMLINNSVFVKTWEEVLSSRNFQMPETEFWEEVIPHIKRKNKEFVFIAEVYWDKEQELQQFGFDFTYDKKLLERLIHNDIKEIKTHLWADEDFQKKSLRYLENHDEERSVKVFGEERVKAAAISLLTLPGMKLIYDGQCDGKSIKLPVQLKREPDETPNKELRYFYENIFQITKKEIFHLGRWSLLEPNPAWDGNEKFKNFLVWMWSNDDERILVVINYSDQTSQCLIKFDTKHFEDEFPLKDLLNEIVYIRSAKEIINRGLYIELEPYKSHIFSF